MAVFGKLRDLAALNPRTIQSVTM